MDHREVGRNKKAKTIDVQENFHLTRKQRQTWFKKWFKIVRNHSNRYLRLSLYYGRNETYLGTRRSDKCLLITNLSSTGFVFCFFSSIGTHRILSGNEHNVNIWFKRIQNISSRQLKRIKKKNSFITRGNKDIKSNFQMTTGQIKKGWNIS